LSARRYAFAWAGDRPTATNGRMVNCSLNMLDAGPCPVRLGSCRRRQLPNLRGSRQP
jgi:hypothetical protein